VNHLWSNITDKTGKQQAPLTDLCPPSKEKLYKTTLLACGTNKIAVTIRCLSYVCQYLMLTINHYLTINQ